MLVPYLIPERFLFGESRISCGHRRTGKGKDSTRVLLEAQRSSTARIPGHVVCYRWLIGAKLHQRLYFA